LRRRKLNVLRDSPKSAWPPLAAVAVNGPKYWLKLSPARSQKASPRFTGVVRSANTRAGLFGPKVPPT
jgi:hypothetical protein